MISNFIFDVVQVIECDTTHASAVMRRRNGMVIKGVDQRVSQSSTVNAVSGE